MAHAAGRARARAASPKLRSPEFIATAAAVEVAARPFGSSGGNQDAIVTESHGTSRELLTVAPGTLAVGAEIGKGRFKRVHRGWHRRFGAIVVLRYVDEGQEADANELNILKRFARQGGCHYVPKVLGLCGDRVIQEYALWGSLISALQDNEVQPRLTAAHKRCIATQLARAGSFLQQMRIVHADLSCRNALLFWLEEDPQYTIAKVTDFGLAIVLPAGCDSVDRKQPQATRWCAPETVAHLTLSHRSDVWALGTTLWELFANGAAPWARRHRRSDVAARLRDLAETNGAAEGGPDISADFQLPLSACGLTAHNIVLSCLQAAEDDRPSFAQLLRSLGDISQVAPLPDSESVADADSEEEEATPSEASSGRKVAGSVSTMDTTCASTEVCQEKQPGEKVLEVIVNRFQKIKEFLLTPAALMALGEDTVQEMLCELDDAQIREAEFANFQSPAKARSPSEAPSVPSLKGLMSHVALLSDPTSGPPSARGTPSASAGAPNLNSTEYIVPLVQCGGAWVQTQHLPPPRPDAWTVTSYISPALRRQDFASKEDAWAAFGDEKDKPCVLRDPRGTEAAVRSWLPPRGCSQMAWR